VTQLDEVIPPDDVLRYIFHCVLEVKPVSVAIYRSFVRVLKCDFVYPIAERFVFHVMRYTVQLFTIIDRMIGSNQVAKDRTHSSSSEFGIVPINTPP